MAEGAKLFHPVNRRTFEDPRSHIIFDDAKAYFAAAEAKYDLVVSEPSNPWVAGVSSLFTVEFYREIKRYLADDGLLGQWIHGYELSDALLLSVLAAVDREFADYRIYRVGNRDWLILASTREHGVGDLHDQPLAWPDFAAEAEVLGMSTRDQIEVLLVANRELLHPYLSAVTPNTDARPILDNGAERARFFGDSAEALLELREFPFPLAEVLGGVERLPYATRMSDRRVDKHVLVEPERALLLMRLWKNDDRRAHSGAASIRIYLSERDSFRATPRDGFDPKAWFDAVYAVYHATASWIDLANSGFWAEVLETAADEAITDEVRRAIMVLDAALRRDGPRLRELVEGELRDGSLLDPLELGLAGAVGLVLDDAPASERQAFAAAYLRPHLIDPPEFSEDIAFAMVLAWMER
jgi:spermidine synthase